MSVTMYTTTWCGYCQRLKAQMGREGIEFTEVDIELNPEAADFVMSVNGGNQTVPTLLFPDGSAATNPSINDVKARLGL
jgi:mycoredoxin